MSDRNGSVEPAEMVVQDIVGRLREQAQAPALAWLRDAADEIERLRNLVAGLLPFMINDMQQGLQVGAAEEGHSDQCDDCLWYDSSLVWKKRIEDGYFEPIEIVFE